MPEAEPESILTIEVVTDTMTMYHDIVFENDVGYLWTIAQGPPAGVEIPEVVGAYTVLAQFDPALTGLQAVAMLLSLAKGTIVASSPEVAQFLGIVALPEFEVVS